MILDTLGHPSPSTSSIKVGNRPPGGCVRYSALTRRKALFCRFRPLVGLSPTLPPGGRQPTSISNLSTDWFHNSNTSETTYRGAIYRGSVSPIMLRCVANAISGQLFLLDKCPKQAQRRRFDFANNSAASALERCP